MDTTIEALWGIDSETGEELLIEIAAGKVLARRIHGQIVDPAKPC